MWPLLRLLGYSLLLSSRTILFTWSSGTTKAPNKRVAPVSVGHSNPSPDGPRAPTQEPSKDKEERLCKGTYIGLKRKFNEGGRFQDWLSLFFCFCRLTFLCRWYVMMTCYWVPFTSWYASSCPVGALLTRLEARCVERYYVGRRLVACRIFACTSRHRFGPVARADHLSRTAPLHFDRTHANVIYLQSKLATHADIPSCFALLR